MAGANAYGPGQLVGGRFQVLDMAQEGGMAQVFRANDLHTNTQVALKVLKPGAAPHDARFRERFIREVELLAELKHENLVRGYQSGTHAGRLYVALEWLEGMDLADMLAARRSLPPKVACGIAVGALRGLAKVHAADVVHRDVKPENIFVVRGKPLPDGAKLLDFGFAKIVRSGTIDLTAEGLVVGTMRYMAPEQITARPLDARADLYAVGLVLYESLAGRPPYDGTSREVMIKIASQSPRPLVSTDGIPEPVRDCVMCALERNPEQRYPDATAMEQALLAAMANL